VRREASRHFRNRKKEYLNTKRDEVQNNSKIKNIRDFFRGINDFKPGYQLRTHIVGDEKGLLQTPKVFWLGGGTISLQLFNLHGFNYVRQTEMHTTQPLVPEPIAFEFKTSIKKKS